MGLITYMRTDSRRLAEEAIAAAKGFSESRYGKEYYPAQARRYKTKGNAQDAHEAIRPSDVTLTPEDVKKDLTSEQYRLYRLIWGRFLACQMASAVYDLSLIHIWTKPPSMSTPILLLGRSRTWPMDAFTS